MLKYFSIITVVAILIVLFIYSAPIDYILSSVPYDSLSHKFYGETHLWCKIIYQAVPVIVILIVLMCFVLLIFGYKLPFARSETNRFAVIILLSLIIGPGLISNMLLKDNWGRPRPYQVIRDKQHFLPFYQADFKNHKSNSFPSGHATIGFFMGVPLLLLKRRKQAIVLSVLAGGLIGLVRILQGGHYLSDVIFSGIIVWVTAALVLYLYDKIIKA